MLVLDNIDLHVLQNGNVEAVFNSSDHFSDSVPVDEE